MLFPKNLSPLLGYTLLLIFMASCHTTTTKKMDQFVTGTIQNFVKKEDHYGVTIKKENDSIVYGVVYKRNFKKYLNKVKKIKTNQKISIKGILNCAEQMKGKKSCIIDIRKIRFRP